jgi:hypothetical protein
MSINNQVSCGRIDVALPLALFLACAGNVALLYVFLL